VVYSISGPVSAVNGQCNAKAPAVGTPEQATTTFTLTNGEFKGEFGAVTGAFSSYADMTGKLDSDGSFHLVSENYQPADIAPLQLSGQFTPTGEVHGSFEMGVPSTLPNNGDTASCMITVSPLSSTFYFGVTDIDWRTAFGEK
jgi:hypothetical protein